MKGGRRGDERRADRQVVIPVSCAGPSPKTSEEMKEQGNAEFKKGAYRDAIHYYSEAITLLLSRLPPDILVSKGHEAKKHELAVLFSNRAECHLKLGNTEQAFSDAKESVAYDGHWYRVR